MKTLVIGATGATGRHVVKQLLDKNCFVKVLVRNSNNLDKSLLDNKNLEVIHKDFSTLTVEELNTYTSDLDVIISCLGHELSFKGIYGKPRLLVSNTVEKLCQSVKQHNKNIKFILMNSSGVINEDLNEKISFAQKLVVSIIRFLVPPHIDNEKAAKYLRVNISQNDDNIKWVIVRPDSLTNEEEISFYEAFESPIRSAIFDSGKTSRINVASFMQTLATCEATWKKWQGKMPVLYNKEK